MKLNITNMVVSLYPGLVFSLVGSIVATSKSSMTQNYMTDNKNINPVASNKIINKREVYCAFVEK